MKKNIKAARCFLTKALMFGLILTVCAAVAEAKGRKFGLFVGINEYSGMIPPLGGCVNDAKNMKATLTAKYGFKAADTTLLTDAQATRDGIISKIKAYEKLAGAGDLFVFHYSGHGSLFPDAQSEEQDETKMIYYEATYPNGEVEIVYPRNKYDATLVPVDADETTSGKPWKNMILDDELYALFSGFTKKGARVVFISDSCFSGSIARNEKNKFPERFVPLHRVFGAKGFDDIKFRKPAKSNAVVKPPKLQGLYLTLTAANANETALDGADDVVRMGLFTSNLVKALNAKGAAQMTYAQLMTNVSKKVSDFAKNNLAHNQTPQLDASFGNPKAVIFTIPPVKPTGGKK